jgi:hypothetical protein
VVSDKYENIEGETTGNQNESIENELMLWVKKINHGYNWKHRHDVSFYHIHNFLILACPATHASNSSDAQTQSSQNGC